MLLKNKLNQIKTVALGLLTALFLISCLPIQSQAQGKTKVVVSILPTAYLVERIGGETVDVSVLVGPGQSPATYEPTPKQMAQISLADLYFRIGVPFEKAWIEKIAANAPSMKVVDLREGIKLRQVEGHHHHHEGEEGHAEDEHAATLDPHSWLSPNNAQAMAQSIFESLCKVQPDNQSLYQKRLDALIADLKFADAEIKTILAPLKNRRFMVFHPSWGYFADEYGLEQVPIEIEGKSPSAKDLAMLIEHAREENIKVIFVQKQFSDASAKTVATAIGGKVVAMDPLSKDYINNLKTIAKTLAEGLQ